MCPPHLQRIWVSVQFVSNQKHCVWKMEAMLTKLIELKCKQFLKPCISKGTKCIDNGWRSGNLFTQQSTIKYLRFITMLVTTGVMEMGKAASILLGPQDLIKKTKRGTYDTWQLMPSERCSRDSDRVKVHKQEWQWHFSPNLKGEKKHPKGRWKKLVFQMEGKLRSKVAEMRIVT